MHNSNWAAAAWGGSVRVSFIAAFIPGFGPVAGAPRFCNIPRKTITCRSSGRRGPRKPAGYEGAVCGSATALFRSVFIQGAFGGSLGFVGRVCGTAVLAMLPPVAVLVPMQE